MFIQKSIEFNIDLNAKDMNGQTAFQLACLYGHLDTVEILIKNSRQFNIDLNIKDNKIWSYKDC